MADHGIELDRLDKGELMCLVNEVLEYGRLTPRILAAARWRAAALRSTRLDVAADDALRDYLVACDLEKRTVEGGRENLKLLKTRQDKQLAMKRAFASSREAMERVERRWKELRALDEEGAR